MYELSKKITFWPSKKGVCEVSQKEMPRNNEIKGGRLPVWFLSQVAASLTKFSL